MLQAHETKPVQGDWFSECMKYRKCFNIELSNQEIKSLTRICFRKITKQKCEELAFKELITKKEKGSKGSTLKYGQCLSMADFLCPNDKLSVEDQIQIFQIRSQINHLPSNKGEQTYCATRCGEFFENSHFLQCTILNQVEENDIEDLINGDINTMKTALLKWNKNIKKIEEISTLDPV